MQRLAEIALAAEWSVARGFDGKPRGFGANRFLCPQKTQTRPSRAIEPTCLPGSLG